jgi:hypothetical protein
MLGWAILAGVGAVVVGISAYFALRHDCKRMPSLDEYVGGLFPDEPDGPKRFHYIWWECPKCKKPIDENNRRERVRAETCADKGESIHIHKAARGYS